MSTPVTLLNGTYSKYADKINLEFLQRMDGLYVYYHCHWWYRGQMFYYFKHCHGFLNGLALLVMALSVVVGAVWEDSLVMIGLMRIWNHRERVERIQEFFLSDGHVSLCLYDV